MPTGATDEGTQKKLKAHPRPSPKVCGWLCPLSSELTVDPVIAADGITYERSAVEKLLACDDKEGSAARRLLGTKALVCDREARRQIQLLVTFGALEELPELRGSLPWLTWLFKQGLVERAAQLGLAEACEAMGARGNRPRLG